MYEINHMPKIIELGYVGETNFRPIEIDMTAWMKDNPDGVPSIICIQPYDDESDAFICGSTFEDNILRWVPSAGELGTAEGYGEIQIWLEETENTTTTKRGKSARVKTYVKAAVTSASPDTPAAQTSWMSQMTNLKTQTVNAANDALGYKNTAAQKADDAEAAKLAAETAQGKAEDAQEAAEAAQGAAEDAQEAAETAQGKAEDAQLAAETAQGKAEDAQEAAETAQGKAEDAQAAAENLVGQITTEAEEATAAISEAIDDAQDALEATAAAAVEDIEEAIDELPKVEYKRIDPDSSFSHVSGLDHDDVKAYSINIIPVLSGHTWSPEAGEMLIVKMKDDIYVPASPLDTYFNIIGGTGQLRIFYIRLTNIMGAEYPVGTRLFEKGRMYVIRATGTNTTEGYYYIREFEILDFTAGATPETTAAATAAAGSASDAASSAEAAEAWATGEIDGTPVPSTAPQYNNNAEYHATQAGQSANAANEAKNAAEAATVHQPTVGQNGNWFIWNQQTGAYVDTTIPATGQASEITILSPVENTVTLSPCPVTYNFGERSVLTVTVTATSQYHFLVTCPSGAVCDLTMNGITGTTGDTLAAGKTYEIDIWAGIALIKEVEVTPVT